MEFDLIMIGKRIKEARNNKNLTQAQLAELIDVSTSYLGMMERALGHVSLENIIKISNVLEMPIAFFVQDSIAQPNESDIDKQINNELSMLTDIQKGYILQSIKTFRLFCKNLVNGILK